MLNIIQVCQMGEGRLVAPPTEDTGLRVAWSRFERRCLLFLYLPVILVTLRILSVLSMAKLNLSSSTYVSSGWPYGLSAWFAVDRKTQGEPNDFYHR